MYSEHIQGWFLKLISFWRQTETCFRTPCFWPLSCTVRQDMSAWGASEGGHWEKTECPWGASARHLAWCDCFWTGWCHSCFQATLSDFRPIDHWKCIWQQLVVAIVVIWEDLAGAFSIFLCIFNPAQWDDAPNAGAGWWGGGERLQVWRKTWKAWWLGRVAGYSPSWWFIFLGKWEEKSWRFICFICFIPLGKEFMHPSLCSLCFFLPPPMGMKSFKHPYVQLRKPRCSSWNSELPRSGTASALGCEAKGGRQIAGGLGGESGPGGGRSEEVAHPDASLLHHAG